MGGIPVNSSRKTKIEPDFNVNNNSIDQELSDSVRELLLIQEKNYVTGGNNPNQVRVGSVNNLRTENNKIRKEGGVQNSKQNSMDNKLQYNTQPQPTEMTKKLDSNVIPDNKRIKPQQIMDKSKDGTTILKINLAINHRPSDEEEEENYELKYIEKYYGNSQKSVKLRKQEIGDDGKIIRYYENNKREVIFPSGVRKEIFEDGFQTVYFVNKDIKQVSFFITLLRYFRMESKFIISMTLKLHKRHFLMV